MPRPSLDFWFEFGSTYSYLSAARIETAADVAGVDLRWRPFLLGPIFRSQGWSDSPFNVYPVKGRYMWRDMERLCEAAGLPLQRSTVFPRNGLLCARVATVAAADARQGRGPNWCPAFTRAAYHASFAEDRDIADAAVVAAILRDIGRDPEAELARAATEETKSALRAGTEEAVALGIFGAPSFLAAGELFWGNDRLGAALEWARRGNQAGASGPGLE